MEDTGVVFAKNTLMLKLERERVCLERKITWSDFWMSICVYLWILFLISYIVIPRLNGQ